MCYRCCVKDVQQMCYRWRQGIYRRGLLFFPQCVFPHDRWFVFPMSFPMSFILTDDVLQMMCYRCCVKDVQQMCYRWRQGIYRRGLLFFPQCVFPHDRWFVFPMYFPMSSILTDDVLQMMSGPTICPLLCDVASRFRPLSLALSRNRYYSSFALFGH